MIVGQHYRGENSMGLLDKDGNKIKPCSGTFHDINFMRGTFRRLGYKTTMVTDKHKPLEFLKFQEKVKAFGTDIQSGGTMVFYFSGHGSPCLIGTTPYWSLIEDLIKDVNPGVTIVVILDMCLAKKVTKYSSIKYETTTEGKWESKSQLSYMNSTNESSTDPLVICLNCVEADETTPDTHERLSYGGTVMKKGSVFTHELHRCMLQDIGKNVFKAFSPKEFLNSYGRYYKNPPKLTPNITTNKKWDLWKMSFRKLFTGKPICNEKNQVNPAYLAE